MRGALSCQVATFPKSGTTFVTNICHQLRSRCEANDFEEITAICPWIDLAVDVGQNLEDDHAHEPRVFKSHMNPSNLNPGGKAIFVVRDPVNVILSMFAFLKAKKPPLPFMAPVETPLDLIDHMFWQQGPFTSSSKRGNVWQFLVEIYFARKRTDVLVVPYEDAIKNPATWIAKIGTLMAVENCDDDLVANVRKHSDKQYMIDHESQFDDHWITDQQIKLKGEQQMALASKVAKVAHDKPDGLDEACLLYTSPSPRDQRGSRMPSSA